jgi:hypothetical protein
MHQYCPSLACTVKQNLFSVRRKRNSLAIATGCAVLAISGGKKGHFGHTKRPCSIGNALIKTSRCN